MLIASTVREELCQTQALNARYSMQLAESHKTQDIAVFMAQEGLKQVEGLKRRVSGELHGCR